MGFIHIFCLFVLEEYLMERLTSVHIIQRKIASWNFKKEGIIIKFQTQSNEYLTLQVQSIPI